MLEFAITLPFQEQGSILKLEIPPDWLVTGIKTESRFIARNQVQNIIPRHSTKPTRVRSSHWDHAMVLNPHLQPPRVTENQNVQAH